MDDNFTNNAQSVYLASLSQSKKILFLQKQLSNSDIYTKTLQQDLQSMKLTINRLIKQRTNHEVLAKITQNLYRIERRCREMQQYLKQSNAKLLIEMQLRIQEKAEYYEKIRQLQVQIDLIRKTNKDKEQEFTIIVNKLRKYQDIRELMLDQKIGKENKKMLTMKEDDKENIIKDLTEQLDFYKKIHKQDRAQIDKKVAILSFALENRQNYQTLREQYLANIENSGKIYQKQRVKYEKLAAIEKNGKKNLSKDKKTKFSENMNENTKQLIKQIKKLVISNKLLEAALNESIYKNHELVLNNQILMDANIQMQEKINEFKKKQISITKFKLGSGSYKQIQIPKKSMRKSQTLNMFKQSRESLILRESQDDSALLDGGISIAEIVRQKQLKQYLQTLKSKDYHVNVDELNRDVHKMSQFLILCLGTRHKDLKPNERLTYSYIIQKESEKKDNRSLSATGKEYRQPLQKSPRKLSQYLPEQINTTKQARKKPDFLKVPTASQTKINDPKTDEYSFKVEQY